MNGKIYVQVSSLYLLEQIVQGIIIIIIIIVCIRSLQELSFVNNHSDVVK